MEKIIKLSGRIDTNNVDEIENNINEDIKDFDGEIIFDASELEYISSAGLRMILRIKKKNSNTKVINCKSEVYEIFEMTGFSEMMDIAKAFREISIDGCEKIGDGFYGTVYRYDPETIVKVYKKPDSLDMVKREKELARKAFVLGIPTAIPYDIVKVGDKYGSVFELLDCKPLSESIQEGESIDSIAKSCVEVLKKIHTTELKPGELSSRKILIFDMVNTCKDYLSDEIFEKLNKFINDIPDLNTMLHGDFHIKNLMKQGDDLLLIDMDTLSVGHPIFEFGGMYATYKGFSCINHNNPQEFLGISYEQSEKMWELIYHYYFDNKSEEELDNLLEKIKILSYLEVLFIRSKFIDKDDEIQKKEIEFCQNYLAENLPKLVK